MNITKISKLLLIGLLIIIINSTLQSKGWAYTTTLQEISQQNATQLLRVSLEPGDTKDTVNVYLYTSDNYPVIKEKNSGSLAHIVDLFETGISATNNISVKKVSDVISKVKIVPYINTSNPQKTDMSRVIIDAKTPGIKYNIFVKTLKTSSDAKNKVTAKVYYPPKQNNNIPQSMAIFSPLDDDILAQLPQEKVNNPTAIPSVPPNKSINSANTSNNSTKLKVNPPQTITPPVTQQNVQNLPEITGTPVGTQTVPPISEQPVPPSVATTTATTEEPSQGVETPPPPPKESASTVQTVLSKPVALGLMIFAALSLFIVVILMFILIKKIIAQKSKNKAAGKTNNSAIDNLPIGFEEMDPLQTSLNTAVDSIQPTKTTAINGTIIDEVEEVIVLDSFKISDSKNIYLVKFMDSISLICSIKDDVTVLYNFESYELANSAPNIKVSEKYKVTGKEMIEISIGDWKAVLASENNHVSINNVLSS